MRDKLFGDGNPLVGVADCVALQALVRPALPAMRGSGTGIDLRLNQLVGEFLAMIDLPRGAWRETTCRKP